jgi:hypothetical protein
MSASAWGEKGHLIVNRLAVDAATPKLPEFMKAGRDHLIYNSYEPDRWREEAGTPMSVAQAPDHFFDSEYWGSISTIEPNRYLFMEKVAERKIKLEAIGYLPYAIIEYYGRLVNAFRHWRESKTAADRDTARANAIFYAGVIGHYVADGSQPLHMTIHFNGWVNGAPNPKDYTKDRHLHARYEIDYVNAAIQDFIVRPKVVAPTRLNDVFGSIKQYLTQTFSDVEPLYELEKSGEFNPLRPQPKGTDFIATQIARASTMLGSLWYTAWLESGEPNPKQ